MKESAILASMKVTLDFLVTIIMLAVVGACIGYCVGSTFEAIGRFFKRQSLNFDA